MSHEVPFHLIPDEIAAICGRLQRSGHGAYLVGGGVRDLLLGREVSDWDIATSARPEQVQRLFAKTIPIGIRHGTVAVVLHHHQVDVTTYRGESSYSDGRHPDHVVFVGSLQEDLQRRDFTINAIALDPVSRELVDPIHGRADLKHRLIRAVGEPLERFQEDGLRPMRAVRFAAVLEFTVEEETLEAIPASLASFRQVSIERIRDEVLKLLAARQPSIGLDLMRRSGLLAEVVPDLVDPGHYAKGAAATDAIAPNPVLRLAALLHALPDPRLREITGRLRLPKVQLRRICHLGAQARQLQVPAVPPTPAALRRLARRVGLEHLDDLLALKRAVIAGGDDASIQLPALDAMAHELAVVLAPHPPLAVGDLAVDGDKVTARLGRPAGPWVGRILATLLERVIDDPSLNDERTLLALVDQLARPDDSKR